MAFWKKRYVSKYTGKEIDEAIEKVETGQAGTVVIANPETTGTEADLTALQVAETKYLIPEGFVNPMNAAGDLIVGGTDGAAEKLAKGTAGQVLTMNAGATAPEWAALPAPSGVSYLTTAPTEANTDGTLKFVVLATEPATKYSGYIYFIG